MLSQSLKAAECCSFGRVYSPGKLRCHKSIFFSPFFLLAAKEQHYHAEGFPLLPALFSPAPRCMSSALPFGDEPSSHVSHPAPGGVFPLIHIERSFDVKLLCFLILK